MMITQAAIAAMILKRTVCSKAFISLALSLGNDAPVVDAFQRFIDISSGTIRVVYIFLLRLSADDYIAFKNITRDFERIGWAAAGYEALTHPEGTAPFDEVTDLIEALCNGCNQDAHAII
ncbi:hypothetical protein [Paraburkholderia sp. J67]|uniref:hypothetical protein n=1 Tax=Paraburkholderia sp. J67 TaxID=2805435 RepID=UPI002ABD2925|nr:hypothetical protein [Paraburkholderia sp. J67]